MAAGMIEATIPSDNVGWAKQVRPAMAAGMIEATIPSDNVGAIYSGTCFAPTRSMTTTMPAMPSISLGG